MKLSRFLFASFMAVAGLSASAQKITAADLRLLGKKEDSLKVLAKNMSADDETADRMRSDSLFIKTLIRSLQVKNSFYYAFDSVQGISKLYAPDSSFKLFTWQLRFDNDYAFIRQRGAIQLRTADGSLKLVPLKDYSEFADNPLDSTRTKSNWIGAVYYNILKNTYGGKSYYTLLGLDGNSYRTSKKWLEVLTFDAQQNPVFGAQKFFSFAKDTPTHPAQYRFGMEYKKEASATLNYNEELQMILVDHLISETDEPESAWTFVPDGDYEGFKWVDGKWQHVNKVFTGGIDMKNADPLLGNAPMEDALLDKDGNVNEEKLEKQNQKNKTGTPVKPTPAKPVKKG